MTEEQENAAKWDRIEEYVQSKARAANLAGQLASWGRDLVEVGKLLQERPALLQLSELRSKPTGNTMADAIESLKQEEELLESLGRTLRGIGIEPF